MKNITFINQLFYSGKLNVSPATGAHGIYRRFNVSPVAHTVTFDIDLGSLTSAAIVVHSVNSSGSRTGTYYIGNINSSGPKSYNFTATSSHTAVDIEIRRSSSSGTYTVDNITLAQNPGFPFATSDFTNPVIVPPTIDGWGFNTQTTKVTAPIYLSSKRLLPNGPLYQTFNIDDNASYKLDFNFIKGTVANGKVEVFKILSNNTEVSILSQTLSTNGNYSYTVTPGEDKMRVQFSGTSAGNYYVDDIEITEFVYNEQYSTDFESTTIVQPDLDGWLCDLSTAYLTADAPSGQPERMIVIGNNTSGAYQYFSAKAGNAYTLDYVLGYPGGVGPMEVEIYERNPGQSLTYLASSTVSSAGAHSLSFTPTKSEIYVHFASNNKFALHDIVLEYEYQSMVVHVKYGETKYRYGFNGMEGDDEVKEERNSYDFRARMYDPRVGRWLSRDAASHKYPEWTPYKYALDDPLNWIDINGNEEFPTYADYLKWAKKNNKPALAREKMYTEGHWLFEDKKGYSENGIKSANGIYYRMANYRNLLKSDASQYHNLIDRMYFYAWADDYFNRQEHKVKWMDAAYQTVFKLYMLQTSAAMSLGISNDEINSFIDRGNKLILDDMIKKMASLEGINPLKKSDALKWDAQALADEQQLIQAEYDLLSNESIDILQKNLETYDGFEGDIRKPTDRWVYGMKKMGYNVTADMMPKPNGDYTKVNLNLSDDGNVEKIE